MKLILNDFTFKYLTRQAERHKELEVLGKRLADQGKMLTISKNDMRVLEHFISGRVKLVGATIMAYNKRGAKGEQGLEVYLNRAEVLLKEISSLHKLIKAKLK